MLKSELWIGIYALLKLFRHHWSKAMWHPRGFTSFVPSHLAWTRPRLSSFSDDMATGGVVTGNVPRAFAITGPLALHPSCPCLKHSRSPEVLEFPSTPASMVEINPPLNPMVEILPRSMHRLKGISVLLTLNTLFSTRISSRVPKPRNPAMWLRPSALLEHTF
jgi:hypothetical protein